MYSASMKKTRHLWPRQCPRAQVKPSVSGLKAQDTGSVQPHDWQTKASHVCLLKMHMNMKVSEEHPLQPCMAAQQRIKKYVHEHGVKNTATSWPVLRECGQESWQFYWFTVTVKFSNSMLDSNSETLRRVLKANLHLADRDDSCWLAHVSKAFSGMRNEEGFKQKMLSALKIPTQDFIRDLRYGQQKVWREADALSPPER
eukprot:1136365-Pelagomonas_calceolata.AAC.1